MMENDDFFQVQEFDKIHHQKHVSLLVCQSNKNQKPFNQLKAQICANIMMDRRGQTHESPQNSSIYPQSSNNLPTSNDGCHFIAS